MTLRPLTDSSVVEFDGVGRLHCTSAQPRLALRRSWRRIFQPARRRGWPDPVRRFRWESRGSFRSCELAPACPPGALLSTTSTFKPSDAAYTAAAKPLGLHRRQSDRTRRLRQFRRLIRSIPQFPHWWDCEAPSCRGRSEPGYRHMPISKWSSTLCTSGSRSTST